MNHLVVILLWFSVLGCGALAGVYFTFSGFVMAALGRLEPSVAVAAMVSINRRIMRSAFMPLFLATTASALGLAVLAPFHWDEPETVTMLVGGLIYVIGMFVCTIAFNLPLNDALAEVGPGSPAAGAAWADYRRDWTRWNHVRTVSAAVATACFTAALRVA